MAGTYCKTAALVLAAAVCIAPVRAQDTATIVGDYCLQGVREVGSCIRLSAGGRFEYFLAYGAYDENSEGTWKLEKGEVVVDSLPYDRRPTFTFKRMQRGSGDGYDVIVENGEGRSLTYIDVSVTCDGRTRRAGVTGAEGFRIDCVKAPTEVSLGLRMYGLAPQAIDVADRAGSEKVYVFEFDAGDLGRKKFVAQRLLFKADGALVMVFAGSPVTEWNGKSFENIRSR